MTEFSDMFRLSNNISSTTGYVLTFDMDSPKDWDDWYSPISRNSTYSVGTDGSVTTNRKSKEEYDGLTTGKDDYRGADIQAEW